MLRTRVHATKAAVEEGIVPGGGVAYFWARKALLEQKLEGEEKLGLEILYQALEKPTRMIVENAGIDSGWVIREIESQGGNHGYNVMTMKFEDMIKSGIVDPAKVTRSALQNAVSVASMILSTEASSLIFLRRRSPECPRCPAV